jgi:hypothetical protein
VPISLPGLSAFLVSASVGALFFVTLPASYSVPHRGCATPLVPDGLMVSGTSAIYSKPMPRFSPSRGFFMVGFGRRPSPLATCRW